MDLKRLFDWQPIGGLEYLFRPGVRHSWGGPFNGQVGRQLLVRELHATYDFHYVVETGTYRGTTTEYLSDLLDGPVYSAEVSRRHYGYAWIRLRNKANVALARADSRSFLRELFSSGTLDRSTPGFFYLDAHGHRALPLWEELELIVRGSDAYVILIDDFRVPFFPGYEFDDYGGPDVLELANVPASVLERTQVAFPSLPPAVETGARTGCLVLAPVESGVNLADDFILLRRH